jgi:polyhydroxybutyrate depolymerase
VVGTAAAFSLASCSEAGSSTPPKSATTSLKPATGTGCGIKAAPGSTTIAVSIGDHLRTAIVHVPTGYSGSEKVPLVLNMHGSGSTSLGQELFTGMDGTSDAHGFIVAYPQGLIPEGTGFDWNVPNEPLVGGQAVPANAPDDVSFLTGLVSDLEHRYCIDPNRVYATGFSGGARTASQLACDASGVFAAVAAVSGLRRPSPCPAGRAVAVIAFHGTADPIDPYGGNGEAYWTYSVLQAAQRWASQDACRKAATTSHPDAGVTLTLYTGCRDGATVGLYTIAGEGHEWPGGPAMPRRLTKLLGPQSSAVDANEVIWAFFEAHPLP